MPCGLRGAEVRPSMDISIGIDIHEEPFQYGQKHDRQHQRR